MKRFQNTYIDALEQLAGMQKLNIRFTDIRPGFVSTDLLNDGKHYPLLMRPEKVAKRIVRALNHRQRVVVIDWRYAIIVFFWRMIPRRIWKQLPIRTGQKPTEKKIARSDNRSFSKTRYICPGTLRNKNNEERY